MFYEKLKFEFEIWHFFVLVYLQLVIPAAPLSTLSHFHYYFYAIIMHWHTYFKTHTRVRTVGVGYYSVEETASSRVNFITKFTKANSLKSNNNTSNPTYMNTHTHTHTPLVKFTRRTMQSCGMKRFCLHKIFTFQQS